MNWIDIEDEKPPMHKMVIVDTDKGVAVGCCGQFGDFENVLFGWVGAPTQDCTVKKWMPLPKSVSRIE